MTPDVHTACPACPQAWRDLYAVARAVLQRERTAATPEYADLAWAVANAAPLVDAHYANQWHCLSDELAAARAAVVELPLYPPPPKFPEFDQVAP